MSHSNEDYAAFIGRNVHKFLPKFNGFRMNPRGFHFSWNWAAFFFTFWWFLYRKMYLWAAVCLVSMWIPYFSLLIWVGWGIAANTLYYRHASMKIAQLQVTHGSGYGVYLPDAGGVNGWVPWVAILVSGGFVLLALLGFIGMAFLTALWLPSLGTPYVPGMEI